MCLTVIDVGQGDALLLSFSTGSHWLVDGGGVPGGGYDVGAFRLMPALRRLGISRLDKVLVTHGHSDHFDGLFAVMQQVEVGELWVPSRRRLPPRMASLLRESEARGVTIRVAELGDPLVGPAPPVEAQLLYPWPGWDEDGSSAGSFENNRSLVLRLQLGRLSFLLTGDIEREAESRLLRAGVDLKATVLKSPHHGSNSSSSPAFVDAVDPLVVVAGIGAGNRFGFPHASVASRYLQRGSPFYWTGRHGHLRACTDGFALAVEQRGNRGPWRHLAIWSPEAVSKWWRSSQRVREGGLAVGAAESGRCGEGNGNSSNVGKLLRKKQRRGRRRASVKGKDARGGMDKEDQQVGDRGRGLGPPSRQWQRDRKRREKLRAPWKGRR